MTLTETFRKALPLIVVMIVLPHLGAIGATSDSDRDAIGVMALGYTSNRSSFTFLTSKFTLTRRTAASLDEAFVEKSTGDIRHGIWIVKGSKVRFELLPDQTSLNNSLRNRRDAIPTSSNGPVRRWISQGDQGWSLSHSILLGAANLIRDSPTGYIGGPFDMGLMGMSERDGPDVVLRKALDGTFNAKFEGAKEIRGHRGMSATVESDHGTCNYVLDPERGYLPLLITSTTDEVNYRAYVTEMRKCSGDRWFPTKSVVIWTPDKGPPFNIQQVSVTELDVDRPPDDREFSLTLSKGTIVDERNSKEPNALRLARDEQINVDDLDDLARRCAANYRANLKVVTKGEMTRGRSSYRHFLIAANVIAVLAILSVMYFRRRQRSV